MIETSPPVPSHGFRWCGHARGAGVWIKTETNDLKDDHRMRIMGLDLSINGTGVCTPDCKTYTIKCVTGQGDHRINIVRDRIRRDLPGVDLVVMEDFPAKLQAAAAKAIGLVQGSVRSALMDAGVPYTVISPATLKKFATGQGNCDKAAMILAAYKRSSIEFRDNNQCDAWWLHIAGRDHFDLSPPFGLPAIQRKALDVVSWPTGFPSPGRPLTLDLQETMK
jgi:Holliday junction resolvasome RuvABC endonuclease subunit